MHINRIDNLLQIIDSNKSFNKKGETYEKADL